MGNKIKVGAPFLGLKSGLDPRVIPDGYAQDCQNVVCDGVALKPAYGYRNIRALQTNFATPHGLFYISGYNSSNAAVEEYISFERLSTDSAGQCKAYSRNVTTGVPTAITGATGLTTTGQWRGFAWQDTSYWVNPSHSTPAYTHTIADTSSWTALSAPGSPSAALTYSIKYGGGTQNYLSLSFAGITATNGSQVACTGNATNTNSSVQDGNLYVAHTNNPQISSITIDLRSTTAGNSNDFDWFYNDIFAIFLESTTGGNSGTNYNSVGAGFMVDPDSVQIQFVNDTGTTITPSSLQHNFEAVENTAGFRMTIRAEFGAKTRADWGDGSTAAASLATGQANGEIRYLKITYRITSGATNVAYNFLRVAPFVIGGINLLSPEEAANSLQVQLRYSYYNSSTGFESGLSPALFIPGANLLGANTTIGTFPYKLGVWLEVTGTNGSSSDNNRYYIYARNPLNGTYRPRRLATQADSDLTYDVRLTNEERLLLTEYTNVSPFTSTGVKFGVPWRGWVAWFYQGGFQNVRHSRVGEPTKQYQETDMPDDYNKGATFSLADNFGDEAENAFPIDNILVILGAKGCYAQQGSAPYELTPPKKVYDRGVANPFACCEWKDENGTPGVVFVPPSGDEVIFLSVVDATDDRGSRGVPIDLDIKGLVRSYLLDGQSLTSASIRVWVDPRANTLWIAAGLRGLCYRRPSVIDGDRQWEKRLFTMSGGAISYVAIDPTRYQRWIRSTGQFDENEWNSSTSALIEGTNRDGGSAMTAMYWTSRVYAGENTRLDTVFVDRDTLSNTPTITAYCTRQPSGQARTLASGARYVRFSHLQSGFEHSLKIAFSEGDAAIRRVEMEQVSRAGRRVRVA